MDLRLTTAKQGCIICIQTIKFDERIIFMKKILAMIGAVCLILTSCSAVNEKPAETSGETTTSAVSEAETTENSEAAEQTVVSESSPDETETATDEPEAPTDDEIIGDDELVSAARQLLGVLNYIDQIGGGNIPRDDENAIDVDGRQFAKVSAQFTDTADLDEYMRSYLTDSFIESRYSGILGGNEPYYIDIDGELYGYVTAKGCGFQWIMEDGEPVVELKDSADDNYTITTKFDDYGAETEMEVNIVKDNGCWKINSLSYGGISF